MYPFKRSMISVALASAIQAMSVSAIAAEEATPPAEAPKEQAKDAKANAEVIEVYGIRSSIVSSVQEKRILDVIADVVDAGEMSSLPDQSIADALARLPGVTTVRGSGQSSQLNIRGMNGDFIQTTLNGREQATTSAYTESSRWMAFDQYPSELINQAAVYKTPKASLVEGGVAGTVELKTANPLQASKQHNFNVSLMGSQNDLAGDIGGDENGERFSFAYQGKFLDDKLGVALGFAHLKQPNVFEGARAGADGQNGYAEGDFNGDGSSEKYARSLQYQAGYGNDERDGYMASVVFKPSDNFTATLDYFNSKFESEDVRHGVTISGMGDLNNYSRSGVTVAGGVVTAATIAQTNPWRGGDGDPWFEARSEDQSTQADSESLGLNLTWQINDRASVSLDATTSEGTKTRKDRLATMHAYEFGTGSDNAPTWRELSGQTATYVMNGSGTPGLAMSTDLTNLSIMRLSRYEEYPHEYGDEIDAFKVDFKYELDAGWISSVEVGVRDSDRFFSSERGTFQYGSRSGLFSYTDGSGTRQNYCEDDFNNPGNVCAPLSVNGFASVGMVAGAPNHLIVDLNAWADATFGANGHNGVKAFSDDWTFIESGDLSEKTFAYYLMANLDMQLGSIPVRGNIGVRVVETDIKAIGLQNVGGGNGTPITDGLGVTNDYLDHLSYGPTYDDVLPSLNLAFELSDEDVLRFSAADVMGRPPAGQMKGGAGSWFDSEGGVDYYNVWTKGTPYLDPFRATQLDLSYEHYFEDGGAFTAAVFWKDIESLVQKVFYARGTVDFTELGITIPASCVGCEPGFYETFENSDKGGFIRGFELAYTGSFTALPGIFSGLGVTANYSFTESEAEISGGSLIGTKLPIPGLSEDVWSITPFWNIGSFTAHANIRYRGDYVANMPVPGSVTPVMGKEYTTIDAQMSYRFENGLEVVLQGDNLTDEPAETSFFADNALGEYRTFGRQYYFGVNYKF